MSRLAEQQEALVRALVARAATPAGFDQGRIDATIHALLRKRTGDVARVWPALMSDPATRARFLVWADGRPKTSSYEDGLAFARDQRARGGLPPRALAELRRHAPRRRWRRLINVR